MVSVWEEWISKRMTALRLQKGVSAREMSLSLGQSSGYMNKVENGKTFPSMQVFLYICEYFSITPQEFFDLGVADPAELHEAIDHLKALPPEQFASIATLLRTMNNK